MKPEGVALVTGASRGLGRAVALELAKRGFEVLATMRDPKDGADLSARAARSGGRLQVQALDVNDFAANDIPGRLAVVVNNAGIEGPYLPIEHMPSENWREMFETNVFGLLEVTRHAIPALRANGGGVICNITSCSILVPMPLFAAYRASKAAVSAIGESLRSEVAAAGIRVVEIQPGAIATDMLEASARTPEAARHAGYEELANRVHAARLGAGAGIAPESAANLIADAILDDGGPLRYACDPMGDGLLRAWRASDDESMMAGMLALFAPPGR